MERVKSGAVPAATPAAADRVNNYWYSRGNPTTFVFVHGIFSDSRSCWLYHDKPTNRRVYWPDLVLEDSRLGSPSIYLAGYYTAIDSGDFSLRDCAREVFEALQRPERDGSAPVLDAEEIIFLAHSTGGIVVRYFLERHKEVFKHKKVGLLLLASPSLGSVWANIASLAAHYYHQKLGLQLRWAGETLEEIHDRFKELMDNREAVMPYLVGAEACENKMVFRKSIPRLLRWMVPPSWKVVSTLSAGQYFGSVKALRDTDHFSTVKPNGFDAPAHEFLVTFMARARDKFGPQPTASTPALAISGAHQIPASKMSMAQRRTALKQFATGLPVNPARTGAKYRVIGFDLDGTLLRGVEFSWKEVWRHLGFPDEVRKDGMRRYLAGSMPYEEWCDWACKQFRDKGLTRSQFEVIVGSLTVTNKLKHTLEILKNSGFVLAIISGGIDTFVDVMIPEAPQLFHYICINRFIYDNKGVIERVDPTPFDFEGKTAALELICQEHGVTLAESIFIGEGFNDSDVSRHTGLSIAYPGHAQEVQQAARVEIAEDDLSKILPHVLV